jgi:PIN domain nuclease of toxin-antitoxin system
MAATPDRLSPRARAIVESFELFLSAASSWEIAIKHALGKLRLPDPPACRSSRLTLFSRNTT